jgi:hypothetical protein
LLLMLVLVLVLVLELVLVLLLLLLLLLIGSMQCYLALIVRCGWRMDVDRGERPIRHSCVFATVTRFAHRDTRHSRRRIQCHRTA